MEVRVPLCSSSVLLTLHRSGAKASNIHEPADGLSLTVLRTMEKEQKGEHLNKYNDQAQGAGDYYSLKLRMI